MPVEPAAPAPAPDRQEALRRRIEDELARLEPFEVSSYLMAEAPPAQEPDDGRPRATEVEIDAALGRLLWTHRPGTDPRHCHHVLSPGRRLVAVFEPAGVTLSVRPVVAMDDLPALELLRRPAAAGTPPPGYRRIPATLALWRFALFGHHGDTVLPEAFLTRPLHLVRVPPLDRQQMAGRHFKLLQTLSLRHWTFPQLLGATGLSEAQLRRDLGALMLVGALETA